ncbi:DUF3280 domain-containing protein [Breoghania sp.]|uniref:DUF3280 domain-containing protein n=1 Tax=Breoghania sp. TaxID=2065378 RepID=UPI002AA7B252|nr:DUF3280 domain-containing protein [Breoghania sp.]
MAGWGIALLIFALLMPTPGLAGETRVAVLPFLLRDTSMEHPSGRMDEAERARLAMITAELSSMLAARGMALVDLAGHRAEIDALQPPWICPPCGARLAGKSGADVAITGFVHKVSTLIQSVMIIVYDASNAEMLGNASVSIRGNTDEAWRRGVSFIAERQRWGPRVEAALQD